MNRAGSSRTRWAGTVLCLTACLALQGSRALGAITSQEETVPKDAAKTQGPGEREDPEAKPEGRDVYLGRDIAKTMHWRGANWLLRETRENEENGKLLRKWLGVQRGDAVCDLGCGNGYHTLPLARAVGEDGKVFAVDLQPKMLELLSERANWLQMENIVPIECAVDDPRLPAKSTDMVLMVDVYHELSHPVRVLGALRRSLKKDGVVVLVEFRTEDRGVPIKVRHKMSKAQVICEMAANGFTLARETDSLPWQHAMAFGVPKVVDAAHEARELGRGFLAAMAGDDPRIVLPYLARSVDVGGPDGQLMGRSAKEVAIEVGKAMKAGAPISKGARLRLEPMGDGRWEGLISGPADLEVMGQRTRVLIETDAEGRYVVGAWW